MAIPFTLVKDGYDVWLGNFRGNKYSSMHLTLNPEVDMDYWKFSWSQMGRFDIPAILKYITLKTGKAKIAYIGHSMGTTAMFYLFATDYETVK